METQCPGQLACKRATAGRNRKYRLPDQSSLCHAIANRMPTTTGL